MGKDIVLILGSGGPYAPRHIPGQAILHVYLPGVYGGEALARCPLPSPGKSTASEDTSLWKFCQKAVGCPHCNQEW